MRPCIDGRAERELNAVDVAGLTRIRLRSCRSCDGALDCGCECTPELDPRDERRELPGYGMNLAYHPDEVCCSEAARKADIELATSIFRFDVGDHLYRAWCDRQQAGDQAGDVEDCPWGVRAARRSNSWSRRPNIPPLQCPRDRRVTERARHDEEPIA